MNLQKIGYNVIILSPFVSLGVVWAVASGLMFGTLANLSRMTGMDWRATLIWMTGVNAAVNAVQIWGLLLYVAGYRWETDQLARSVDTRLAAWLLFGWGLAVSWFMYTFYQQEVIRWSLEPGVRALIVWDHLEFATWILKGVLWIVAGGVIGATLRARRMEPSDAQGARGGAVQLVGFSGMYVVSFVGSVIAGAELSERLFPARGPLAAYLIAASLIGVFTVLFGLVVRKLHAETMQGR
jgi:hypothetical protein